MTEESKMTMNYRTNVAALFVLAVVLSVRTRATIAAEFEYRTWTNSKGVTVVLAFLGVDGEVVLLRNESGKEFRFPLDQLSDKDQLFVKATLAPNDAERNSMAPFKGKGAEAILRDLVALKEKSSGNSPSMSKQATVLLTPKTRKLKGTGVELGLFVSSNLFDEEKFSARYGNPDETGRATQGGFEDSKYLRYEWLAIVVTEKGEIILLSTAFTGLYKN